MAVKACGNCGYPIAPTHVACPECGGPLSEARPQPANPATPPPLPGYAIMASGRPKDFTNVAIGTLVLWLLFWPAGLIMNMIYLDKARKLERETGIRPEGKTFLLTTWVIFFRVPAVIIIAFGLFALFMGYFHSPFVLKHGQFHAQ